MVSCAKGSCATCFTLISAAKALAEASWHNAALGILMGRVSVVLWPDVSVPGVPWGIPEVSWGFLGVLLAIWDQNIIRPLEDSGPPKN